METCPRTLSVPRWDVLCIVYKIFQILSNARLRTPYWLQRVMISYECSLVPWTSGTKNFPSSYGDIRPHDAYRPITGEQICLMDHNLRCHPVLARGFSERCCVLDQSRASKKIFWFIVKVITLAQGLNFPAKGGWRGGMVKLRIDRRISICSRYLTVASGINFHGQVATSAEQWDKKRFLQGLHRSPCSTGIFLWKLLCLIVIKIKKDSSSSPYQLLVHLTVFLLPII